MKNTNSPPKAQYDPILIGQLMLFLGKKNRKFCLVSRICAYLNILYAPYYMDFIMWTLLYEFFYMDNIRWAIVSSLTAISYGL